MTPDQYRREGAEAMRAAVEALSLPADWRDSPSPKNIRQQRLYMDGVRAIRMAIRAIDVDAVLAGLTPAPGSSRVAVAWRVRVKSDDPEEWSLMHPEGAVDWIERKGVEFQPLYVCPTPDAVARLVEAANQARPVKPCPDCGAQPARVWRPSGAFQMRTECACGRVTNWVMCGHDAVADSDDDTPQPAPDAVARLVEAAQFARNRLEIIADKSWHGDGRDLKRSITGVFADFDAALAAMGADHD